MMSNVTLTIEDFNQERIQKLVPPIIFLCILMILGLPGNAIVIVIYRRDYSKSIYKTIIWNLALVDQVFCLFGIPFNIVRMSEYYTFKSEWACIVGVVLLGFMSLYSTHLIMLLSVYRFRKICFPLRQQWTPRRVNILILCCCGIALLFSLPYFGISKYESYPIGSNLTAHSCSISLTKPSVFSITFSYFFLVLNISYTLSLIMMYSIIGRKMYLQAKILARQSTNVHNSAVTSKITKVSLAIATIFALSFIPLFILQTVKRYIKEESLSYAAFSALKIGERLYVLNHVANPLVYGFFDKSFVDRVRGLFRLKGSAYSGTSQTSTGVQPTASSDVFL